MKVRRMVLADELRGFAIICMVAYHMLYSLIFIYGIDLGPNISQVMFAAQPFGAGLFIVIAGFSSCYSISNFKRGIIILAFGMLITLFTTLIIPDQAIYFGILHFLGISILLYELIKGALRNVQPVILTIILVIVFFMTFNLQSGYLSLPFVESLRVPSGLYSSFLLAPLGLPSVDYISSDYFSIFPWFALFLVGTVLGNFSMKKNCPEFFYVAHLPVLSKTGRHSLPIYILHSLLF